VPAGRRTWPDSPLKSFSAADDTLLHMTASEAGHNGKASRGDGGAASSAPPTEAQAIARAAWTVASTAGTTPLSTADERGITGALSTVFGYHDPVDLGALPRIASGELVRTITDPERRLELIRVLAVLALLDGGTEKGKLGIVVDMATALHVQAEFVDALTQLHLDHARWAGFDMIRANTMTIPGLPWDPDDPYGPFHPYGGDAEDPVLVARFDHLVDLPEGSLGNALYHHYKRNGYTWPGDPDGLAELWAINHDCLHLLSGYSTSAQGELLVAAFTGGQFDPHVDFMESHVLPTIMIYHLGIDINKGLNAGDKARMEDDPDWADNYEGNVHLGLDAAKLWVAIARGRTMTENLYSGHWDFWAHAPEPLEVLRSRWSIPPLDPAMAALDDDQIHREDYERPGLPAPGLVYVPVIADRAP
jgi:hypothetical protein